MAFALSADKRMSTRPMLRVFDKPAGVTTHTSLSDDERKRLFVDPIDGFLEFMSKRSGQPLLPTHRLDVGTAGALVAASDASTAALAATAFESRDVEKVYHFVTDRQARKTFKSGDRIESHITRMKGGRASGGARSGGPQYVSFAPTSIEPMNAVTVIEHVKDHGRFSLWQARPETGKPHQIRLHAEAAGLPILGDTEHGGSAFPALCLHSTQTTLSLADHQTVAWSKQPRWFDKLELLENPRVVTWLAGIERRERLGRSLMSLGISPGETQRWLHVDGGDLRIDQLGSQYHLHWYGESLSDLDRADIDRLLAAWLPTASNKDWYLQLRNNRGGPGGGSTMSEAVVLGRPDLAERWTAGEDELQFSFRRDSGLSAGLFLDQRANRRWLRSVANNRSVLNLFSYTGGFSVAAARAGASQVVSVDLSAKFLEWSKDNFALNALDASDPRYEFRAMNALSYLDWAQKKNLGFDIVICDPPSFARSDSGVFQIEKELEALLERCLTVTNAGGTVLLSINYESMSESELFKRAENVARKMTKTLAAKCKGVVIERLPTPDWDFEFPRESRSMKGFFAKLSTRL